MIPSSSQQFMDCGSEKEPKALITFRFSYIFKFIQQLYPWQCMHAGTQGMPAFQHEHVLVVQFDVLHDHRTTFNKSVGASFFDIFGMNRMKRANWMRI